MIENHVSFGINDDSSIFNGVCDTDNIVTSCKDGTNFPVEFCGDNSGQHGKYWGLASKIEKLQEK